MFSPGFITYSPATGGWSNVYSTDFNGSDEHGSQTAATYLGETASGGRSLSFYFKADTLPTPSSSDYRPLIGADSTGGTAATGLWNVGIRTRPTTFTTPRIDLTVRGQSDVINDTDGYIGSDTTISTGTWYHVVITTSGSAWTVYLNGTQETMGLWSGALSWEGQWYGDSLLSGTITGAVGATASLSNYFDGHLDEITIWSTQLDSTEVAELYNSGTPIDPTTHSESANLTHYWRMGDGDTSPTLTDSAGSDDFTTTNMDASNFVADVA